MPEASRTVPFIKTGFALRALRDSGYTLAAALGEPIDNSIEASANNITLILDEERNDKGKNHIHRITIVDDGDGMSPEILQQYLQLGYSTRHMSNSTIGKYGVGAKLAAFNFARRVEVWSRDDENGDWLYVYIDLDEIYDAELNASGAELGIPYPKTVEIPEHLDGQIPPGTGTIVVWSNVDRLEEGRLAPDAHQLRIEVEKEISRIFRYFISGGINIYMKDRKLLPHDPLFLMENTWAKTCLRGHQELGNDDLSPKVIADRVSVRDGGANAQLTITLYPERVLRVRGKGGDELARKLRIPENQGHISFTRMHREIAYTLIPRMFPGRGVETGDRYIGVEVSFTPEADEYLGVRNVKRGVEPHGKLRKKIRELLRRYIPEARKELQLAWGEMDRGSRKSEGIHGSIARSVKDVNMTMPKGRARGPDDDSERRRALEDLARDVGKDGDQNKDAYLDSIKGLPFVVESVDMPGSELIDITHLGHQSIIRINTRHQFHRNILGPILSIAERDPGDVSGAEAVRLARDVRRAIDLLIIAYAKAEAMHPCPREQYGELRGYWGFFLGTLLTQIRDV